MCITNTNNKNINNPRMIIAKDNVTKTITGLTKAFSNAKKLQIL